MLSSAPFIAELPQDLAGKSTSLFTVQGRYGNNALDGDWELGITSNTSAPPQQQSQRSWGDGRGTRAESFTFAITRSPASLFASPAATSGDFTIGGSNVKASYTDIASYEPNAIKIWARSTTVGGGVTISDLKIRTPGVPGETVFPGTVINVSQGSGTGFQEIIIAGIDFQSSSDGTVTLEGSVAMQFGNAPAPRGSSLQFHVIATHIPWVDLDVDSNNDDKIDPVNGRNGTDDRIEQAAPGLFVPVEGKRSKMLVTIPAGRNAALEIKPDAAGKVQVFSQFAQVSPLTFDKVGPNDEPAIKMADVPGGVTTGAMTTWTLWVAATAPSTSRGDIVFTLTGDNNGLPAWDIVRATAVAVDIDVDSDNDGKIDPENAATGSDEPIEPDQSRGLVVPVYAGDSDRDGLDDTVDFNGIAGRRFAPVKVGLSEGAALAWQWPIRSVGSPDEDLPGLTFTFSFSDAGFGSATGGMFRLWKKDAPDVRNVADLIRTKTGWQPVSRPWWSNCPGICRWMRVRSA